MIERPVALTVGARLSVNLLPGKMLRTLPDPAAADEMTREGAVAALKRRMVISALESESGNKVAAAKRLGISRAYLHRMINKFAIGSADPASSGK